MDFLYTIKEYSISCTRWFSTIYKGIWLDGFILHWDYEKHNWKRSTYKIGEVHYDIANPKIKNPLEDSEKYGHPIVLKRLNDSSNINENFLNEVSNCQI